MTERLEKTVFAKLEPMGDVPLLWWKGDWWSAPRFLDLVESCRTTLERAGFKEGQRLAFMLPNSPLALALALASWSLGGSVAPLNPLGGRETIASTLMLLEPSLLVIPDYAAEQLPLFAPLAIPAVAVPLEGPLPELTCRETSRDTPSLAVIYSTSGTTGQPKAVPLSHGNLLDNIETALSFIDELQAEETLLNVLPNFHSFGFGICSLLPLIAGYRQVVLPSFLPVGETLAALEASGCTVILAVPTMVSLLCSAAARLGRAPKSLRIVLVGGDKVPPGLDEKCRAHLGLPILEGYGLTECSPLVAVNTSYAQRRLGTVGPVIPGYRYEIRNDEGKVLGDGEEGVLWVQGPSVMAGYYRSPEATAERFRDGWFNTGDVARLDDGYLTILDRVTDLIIVGGFNVYPQEVESTLIQHPAVREASVIGSPNSTSGEVPKAFVVLSEGAEKPEVRELIRFCRDRLAHFKTPRKIEFVDELPRSPLGKTLRRVLRDQERSRSAH